MVASTRGSPSAPVLRSIACRRACRRRRRPVRNRSRNASGVGPSLRQVELDPLEEHRAGPVADRVDVLLGVDDVATLLGDEAGGGGDDPRLVGTRQEEHRGHGGRSIAATRSRRPRWRRRRSASRRRRPSGCARGSRCRVAASLNPARSDPIRTATSLAGVDVVDRHRGRIGRHRQQLPAVERPSARRRGAWCGRGGARTRFPSRRGAIGGRAGRRWCGRGSGRRIRTRQRCGSPSRRWPGCRPPRARRGVSPRAASCGDARSWWALEQRHDRVRVAEPGDEPADLDAAAVDGAGERWQRAAGRVRCRRVRRPGRSRRRVPARSRGHLRRRTVRRRRRRASRCGSPAHAR